VRYALAALLVSLLMVAGCGSNQYKKNIEGKNAQLEKDNSELKKQIESVRSQNVMLENQVQTLAELSPETRIEGLYELKSVKLTRYTDFYDKDKNGTKEKLIVYVQPMDSKGDIIKAAGRAEVELWDLNTGSEQGALLKKWQVGADELKGMWFSTIAGASYRLVYDINEIVTSFDKPYTVKMSFTDYVSGKVFTDQYVIKP
jgi:outer membrane murein-binding lipoprotein Lpp